MRYSSVSETAAGGSKGNAVGKLDGLGLICFGDTPLVSLDSRGHVLLLFSGRQRNALVTSRATQYPALSAGVVEEPPGASYALRGGRVCQVADLEFEGIRRTCTPAVSSSASTRSWPRERFMSLQCARRRARCRAFVRSELHPNFRIREEATDRSAQDRRREERRILNLRIPPRAEGVCPRVRRWPRTRGPAPGWGWGAGRGRTPPRARGGGLVRGGYGGGGTGALRGCTGGRSCTKKEEWSFETRAASFRIRIPDPSGVRFLLTTRSTLTQ